MAYAESIAVSSATTSAWLPFKTKEGQDSFTLILEISDTATADVEFAIEDLDSSPTAITHSILTGKTVTSASDLKNTPVTGFRVNCTAHTGGTVTVKVLQTGN